MANIVTRAGKGSALTHAEVDANFTGLNADAATALVRVFTPVDNLAALPASPADGSRVEVLDSTGIRQAANVQNIPGDFPNSGDITSLAVRLRYSAGLNAWVWVSYASKTPDARFVRQSDISSSVSSTSATTVASSAAVKTVKDAVDAVYTSPAFSGTPTAPTAAPGTSTTQIATTAFVGSAIQPVSDDVALALSRGVPAGAVFWFAAASPPAGYLKCNGEVIPNGTGTVQGVTANFSALYAVIGGTHGGAGRLPDLRGVFIRGWDDGAGIDSARVFGSFQGDALASHSHLIDPAGSHVHTYQESTEGGLVANGADRAVGAVQRNTGSAGAHTHPMQNTGGPETRPANKALLACIKY